MQKGNQRILIGFGFVAVGIGLLLRNLNILSYEIEHYVFTWEVLLIAIGSFQISTGNSKGGIILITIGALFWIKDYAHMSSSDFWPVILIVVGLGMFLRSRGHKSGKVEEDASDYIDDLALMGGSKKIVTDQAFKGGRITSIFGGVDLDLRNARLNEGKAEIDTVTIFGAFKTYVPDDWRVHANMTCVFGGFNDKRSSKPPTKSENELTINGVVIFGGGDLLN